VRTTPLIAAVLALCALDGHAQKSTVCTITVNSADERDAFRKYLPEDKYDFVELVERGRSDWLASSCRKGVQCDVLVVSGHFAGTEFYSSKLDVDESLPVEEIERAQCSGSCPGLFARLKEVYLFGCDTLKPEPVKSAAPEIVRGLVRAGQSNADAEAFARALSVRYGESSRDLMRRLFPNVPVIYGFSSLAPHGRVAGPMLDRYFETETGDEIGSGRASESLLRLFGPSSMTAAGGMTDDDPNFDFRGQVCRYYDDRDAPAQKLAFMHRTMGGEMAEVRMSFDRIEKFFATLSEAQRGDPAFVKAAGEMADDRDTRRSYLDLVRGTEDPALRVRMIALARTVGWLTAPEQRAEIVRMMVDVLAGSNVGYGEVELICTLNKDRELTEELAQFKVATLPVRRTADAAALACLGSAKARGTVLKALASLDEQEVQIAQSYLRHRPIVDGAELREVASGVARMKGSAAQVRALETLARHHIADPEIFAELTRLYMHAKSLGVQRAIAEIFIRSDYRGTSSTLLATVLRRHRLPSRGGEDLIDVLLARLE
jgi:hypothetical protein